MRAKLSGAHVVTARIQLETSMWQVVVALCVLAVTFLTILSGSALAAPAAASWSADGLSYPSHFPQNSIGGIFGGPAFFFTAENVGEEATNGLFDFVVKLPSGVNATEVQMEDQRNNFFTCSVSAGEASCSGERPLAPGEVLLMSVGVEVGSVPLGSVLEAIGTITGGSSASAQASAVAEASSADSAFGFAPGRGGLFAAATNGDGNGDVLSGSHPNQLTIGLGFTSNDIPGSFGLFPAEGGVFETSATLPQGMAVDPQAVPMCTGIELNNGACPADTQVGTASPILFTVGLTGAPQPLYNVEPPPGSPAALGFEVFRGVNLNLLGSVRSDGEYQLTAKGADIIQKFTVVGVSVNLWGQPTAATHDAVRGACAGQLGEPLCPVERQNTALVTMPTSCQGQPSVGAEASSWIDQSLIVRRTVPLTGRIGEPLGMQDCDNLAFDPTVRIQPSTANADSPSGLSVDIHQSQDQNYDDRSPAALRDVKVSLASGLVLNPSAGSGLQGCSEAAIGYRPQGELVRFSKGLQTCPSASKIGTAEVQTPLLGHALHGSVFVAEPFKNPFDSLLAIYLAIEDEETGIVAKLGGDVEADPQTGQLTARFTENPELPLEDISLHFFEGQRGVLTTPIVCGSHTTSATLTPWSTPEGADVQLASPFQTAGGCAASEATASKEVSFEAGTVTPLSGAYSPFVLNLGRKDGTQRITGIDATLPEGLLGKLAGISYCPGSGIAQAESREATEEGELEQQSPSCPASSEVGTVNVTAGSGATPIPVSGHAYLAGPYKGAPLSIVAIVPAVAGPFDLGTVVDRVALNVGEYDARIHAVADPLPTIRAGIPFDVRSIELKLDRSNFTLNPTSCEAMAIEGSVTTQAGQTAPLNNRFQVGKCGRLAFKPSLKLSLKGQTKRTGHPALKAVVTYPKGGQYANIARAQVSLPHSEFLDQGNLDLVCKQADLKAGTCPARAIYGKVKAWTPLLDKPLEGNVYLGVGFGYKLPALVAELNGQIRVLLKSKVDTNKHHGIRNTFEAVPDAPVERFVVELKGGKKYGLLENSENICKKPQVAGVSFRAHNGNFLTLSPKIANSCGSGNKRVKGKKHVKKGTH
jgi:hypothetical protein